MSAPLSGRVSRIEIEAEFKRARGLRIGVTITQRALDDSERMVKTRGADVVIAKASGRRWPVAASI